MKAAIRILESHFALWNDEARTEVARAIRVLVLAEKVDWTNVLLMLDKFKTDETYWPHADTQLRAFIEALPAEEK